jgi:hypothetical protein
MKQFAEEARAGRVREGQGAQVKLRRRLQGARTPRFIHPRLQELSFQPENRTRIGSIERCDPEHARASNRHAPRKAIDVPHVVASKGPAVQLLRDQ